MSRVKLVPMALFGALAVSAIAVSSASATWLVGGSPLAGGSAALATTAIVDEPTKLLVPSVSDLTITCSGATFDATSPRIEGTDKGFASSLKFLACNTTAPASGCALAVANQTISTNPILALVAKAAGEADKITFTPETKATFAEFSFNESDTCAFNGVEPVKGAVNVGAPTGQLELVSQAIVGLGSSENNSLEVANSKAYLVGGKALLKLQSGTVEWADK